MNNMQKILENSQITPSEIETIKLSVGGKKACDLKKKQNSEDKVVKFRCDFSSTQVGVMLSRGWTQVILSSLHTNGERRERESYSTLTIKKNIINLNINLYNVQHLYNTIINRIQINGNS